MPKSNESISWSSIKVVVDDVEVTGVYSIDKTDWMTVRMNGGGAKQARGGPAAESVARLMLRELFEEDRSLE